MKQMFLTIMALLVCGTMSLWAQSQPQQKSPAEMAAAEAERLELLLELEGWQVFYVDSTLQNNYANLQKELQGLKDAKVENVNLYLSVRDKWMDKTDNAFRSYFTDEQWAKYLKNGAAKAKKEREKRAAKNSKK